MKRYLGLAITAIVAASMFVAVACGGDDDGGGDGATSPTAVATASKVTVESAWARNSPAGMMPGGGMMTPPAGGMAQGDRGAAYMIIKNTGTADDALVAASSTLASATEVHESAMSGDTVTMRQVDRVAIPAGGSTELKPGGFHIMFIGLNEPLTAGSTITFDLTFEKAGTITVTAEVRSS